MPREIDRETAPDQGMKAVTGRVVKEVWKIAVPGFVLGLAFMALGEFTKERIYHVFPALFAELGTGFIVAAIAVFGYEYLRDVSGVVVEQENFKQQVALFKKINERAAEQALNDDMLRVVKHAKLSEELYETAQQAVAINARSSNGGANPGTFRPGSPEPPILHSEACLNLLAELTHDSMTFSKRLNAFHADVASRSAAPDGYSYSLPDPRAVAGRVLSMLLSSLESEDHYKSVANVLFYEQTLMNMFEQAAEIACGRGIVIQRLFNVTNFEQFPPSEQRFHECRDIIRQHFDVQRRIHERHPNRYQIRFYGGALDAFLPKLFNEETCPHLAELPHAYFGLFCKQRQKATLIFHAREPQRASRVWLAFRNQNDPSEAYFDRMWDLAALAPNPFAGTRFNNNWLDSTVAQLNNRTSDGGQAAGI